MKNIRPNFFKKAVIVCNPKVSWDCGVIFYYKWLRTRSERDRDEGGYRKFFEIEYAEKYLSNLYIGFSINFFIKKNDFSV